MFATTSDAIVRTVAGTFGTVIFAGACLLAATAPAQAGEAASIHAAEAGRVQTVSYGDLNMSSIKGRQAFEMRVKHAARSVCATGSKELRARDAEQRCVRNAMAAAESTITTTIAAN